MKSSATVVAPRAARAPRAVVPASAGPFERAVRARLARLATGRLELVQAGARVVLGPGGAPAAEVAVHDPRFFRALALRGSVGAGEAYADGWWSSPDPVAVVRLFVRNRDALGALEGGLARLSRPLLALAHALRRNSRRGARANIAAHYDLSNEFFGLFLDETLTYSCGVFERPESTLRDASIAKIERLLDSLALGPRDRLLEIGSGWGALAMHAARTRGCHVTTATISRAQHELATERVRAAGLADRVDVVLCDWRDLRGTYDALVSVEMIEAIGHAAYPAFFARCADLLAPHGRMALQAITLADHLYDEARRSVDFIQAHVFPGSCIPSVTALLAAATRASDLRLARLDDIGPHYVRTLAAWRAKLRARREDALALGLTDELLRTFDFYFAYCEGGYAAGQLGDVQLLLTRPGARVRP
jgi:cyclopropane-fatty-acyl-phospholipid synthase